MRGGLKLLPVSGRTEWLQKSIAIWKISFRARQRDTNAFSNSASHV
jgi:hypothetical protein